MKGALDSKAFADLLLRLDEIGVLHEKEHRNMEKNLVSLVKEDKIKVCNLVDLTYCQEMLLAINTFLLSLPNKRPAKILARLTVALQDMVHGGSKEPTLFNIPAKQTPDQSGVSYTPAFGGSKGTAGAYAQGCLAIALDILINGGFKKAEAVAWVASEVKSAQIVDRGGLSVSGKRISNWRDHFSRGQGALAGRRAFDDYQRRKWPVNIEQFLGSPRSDLKKAMAEGIARDLIQRVALAFQQEIAVEQRR